MDVVSNRKTKFGFALGHVMNDMCASMWFTYLLLYFHKVLQFDNIYSGVLLLIGQLADGFSTVFVGIFSDSGDNFWLCNRLGQRKAWHLIGCICVIGSFPFIFSSCFGCEGTHEYAQLIYYASFVVIFQFGWAATQISHLAAIPDLGTSQNERTGLTAIRYGMTVTSNIMVYGTAWAILEGKRSADMITPDDAFAFRDLMLVCISVGAAASIGYHLLVQFPSTHRQIFEVPEAQVAPDSNETEEEGESSQQTTPNGRKSIFSWFKEYQLYQIGLIYMTTRLFVNLSQAYIPLYLQVTLQLKAKYVATVPLTIFVSGFVTSFAMKFLNDKLGRKVTFILGGFIGLAGCIWVHFGCGADDSNIQIVTYVIAVLIGIGGSTMLVTSLSLTAEFISCDTSSSAFIYGLMSLTDKVSNGLAVVLIQHFIPSTIDTCVICREYFREVIMYACGGSAILGILAACSLIPVTIGVRRIPSSNSPNSNITTINEEATERTPLLA